MLKNRLFLIIFFLEIAGFIFAGDFPDSLKTLLKQAKGDTIRLEKLYHTGIRVMQANELSNATVIARNLIAESWNISFLFGQAQGYCLLGFIEKKKNQVDSALFYFNKSLVLFAKLADRKPLAGIYNELGMLYESTENFSQAMLHYQKSLKIYEDIDDGFSVSALCNQLGVLNAILNNNNIAIDYFKRGLVLSGKLSDTSKVSDFYNNIAICYESLNDLQSAKINYEKAMALRMQVKDTVRLAQTLNNIAIVFYKENNYPECLTYLKKSMNLKEKIGNEAELITTYLNIGELFCKTGNLEQSVIYYNKSLDICLRRGDFTFLVDVYKGLAETYFKSGKHDKAYIMLERHLHLKDSIFTIESQKQITETQTKFETEKKQKQIELLTKDKALKDIEVRRQTLLRNSFITGFILMLSLVVVIFRFYRTKQKSNRLLKKKNEEIEEKNEELNQRNVEISAQRDHIEEQRDEIESQRDLVISQKEKIEAIHESLTESIRYAERIQNAVLPGDPHCRCVLQDSDYFVLFKPVNIVSGDFYFIEKRKEFLFFSVADCTGHGVPGAFMSMLGIAFLQEIIAKEAVVSPGQVLDELRQYVIRSLQQKGVSGEQKDGMDIAFCVVNTDTFEMQFAGANNPCYIIQFGNEKNKQIAGGGQFPNFQINKFPNLFEIKGDKMPIGIHDRMAPFTNHVFQLQKGDLIYLMSDGFEDQFGGPKGKKFYAKNIKNLLLANCQLPMANGQQRCNELVELPIASQKQILETTLAEWIGNLDQVDDITVMGIKF